MSERLDSCPKWCVGGHEPDQMVVHVAPVAEVPVTPGEGLGRLGPREHAAGQRVGADPRAPRGGRVVRLTWICGLCGVRNAAWLRTCGGCTWPRSLGHVTRRPTGGGCRS